MAQRLLSLLILILPSVVHAGVFEGFAGVRSAAMGGAQRAVGSSNEAIYLNPASMAAFQRFGIDMEIAYEQPEDMRRMRITAVDSKTSTIAAGVGYETIERAEGLPKLRRTSVAVAYPLGQYIFFGSTGHYITGTKLTGDDESALELFNADVGLSLNLSDVLQLGMSWHNVLDTDEPGLAPESMGFGLAAGTDVLVGAFDVRFRDGADGERLTSYHVGSELFFGGALAARLGYVNQPKSGSSADKEHVIALGGAYVTQAGALAVSMQRALSDGSPWTVAGALKFFM